MSVEQRLADVFVTRHPADAARVLGHSPTEAALELLDALEPDRAALLLDQMPPVTAGAWLEKMAPARAAGALAALDTVHAAVALRAVDLEHRDAILGALPEAARATLRTAIRFPDGTAGALMDASALAVPEDATAAEAIERVRSQPAGRGLYYVYAVGDAGTLTGVMTLRELVLAEPSSSVRSFMQREPASLEARARLEAVAAHPAWNAVYALPVVERGRFVGALRYEALRGIERDLAARAPIDRTVETALALAHVYRIGVASLATWAVTFAGPKR